MASPDLQRAPDVDNSGPVGKHAAVGEPAAARQLGARSEHGVAADVRAQILYRVAERRSVGFSLGDPPLGGPPLGGPPLGGPPLGGPVVRRRAVKPKRPSGERPRHRRPPGVFGVRQIVYALRQIWLLRVRRLPRAFGLRQVVVFGLITALIVIALRTFVVASFYIPSGSMEPTLHGCPGCEPDLVMVERLSYRFSHVSRGDVVVFSKPPALTAPDKELIKRVIGLPGETISGHNGKVWIGDRPLSEPYVNPACGGQNSFDFAPIKIPSGRYFMMGDNRCNSDDSRYFGTVAGNTIVGRAFAVVWPFKHWRWL